MILSTHAIAGAAVAELFPQNPALAFIAAFLSHFVLDAIPHWNYRLKSYKKNESDKLNGDMVISRDFFVDMAKITLDFAAGIGLSLLFFSNGTDWNASIIVLGAIGGMLPDALQFAYWKMKTEPLRSLQKFHKWIHAHVKWELSLGVGLPIQVAMVAIIVLLAKVFIVR